MLHLSEALSISMLVKMNEATGSFLIHKIWGHVDRRVKPMFADREFGSMTQQLNFASHVF